LGYLTGKEYSYYNSFSLWIGFGYNIAIAKNLALTPIIQYEFTAPKNGSMGDTQGLLVGIGIDAFIF
jgi:hypothetical protein